MKREFYEKMRWMTAFVCLCLLVALVASFSSGEGGRVSEERSESWFDWPVDPGPSWNVARISLPECIGLLKGRSRDALVGFYEKKMACADIAKRQGTSLAAIHMLLKRVREKLFECVQAKLGLST